MSRSTQVVATINGQPSILESEIPKERLKIAASKMVDEIEKRRKEGKYSVADRIELERVFYANMVDIIQGKKPDGKTNESLEDESITESGWLQIAKNVVKTKQYIYIDPKTNKTAKNTKNGYILLDLQTANMLSQIADALKKSVNKEKFTNLNILNAVDLGWKLISK